MINELYQLSEAMDKAGVKAQRWHSKYKPIPNIRPNAPCVRISMLGGQVVELSGVLEGLELRKFGDNQGSYPCMNLTPLYRITDELIKKSLKALKPEDIDSAKIEEIESWCQDNCNNWKEKFWKKYKICMDRSTELCKLIPGFTPVQILMEENEFFRDPMKLHREIETAAFKMLRRKEHIDLALQILFYQGDPKKKPEDDCGSLSVALDSPRLIDLKIPAISKKFVSELNNALMDAEKAGELDTASETDAFGLLFVPTEKSTPMPTVKLAGGFDVTLRTMFSGQPCQTRYGRIEDASYPISPEMRGKLHTSLNWLGGSKEHENITWMNIDKGEVLLAYPYRLAEQAISYTRMFGRPRKGNVTFGEEVKQFLIELRNGREAGVDTKADRIQLFILKKIDKARTKVVYTRQTDAYELEKCSEAWTLGCSNLPVFAFGKVKAPFPLDVANVLNCFWKQNGERSTDQYKPISQYHGLELLMNPDFPVTADLHILSEKSRTMGAFLGGLLAKNDLRHSIWERITEMLALVGLMLYRKGIRKENYMEAFPYQYGQLLKVSDELHAMYCRVVRNGDLPPQLVGSSLFQAAAETPLRTMSVLAQRMNPYIAWAKTYHTSGNPPKGSETWRAKWCLQMYEEIAGKLKEVWTADVRFNDEEKAQLFIGYLAALPKREQNRGKDADNSNRVEEVQRV